MHRVIEVFEEELPIAVMLVAQHTPRSFDFAFRRALAEVVYDITRRPHPRGKVWRVRIEGGKDKTMTALTRDRLHAVTRVIFVKARTVIPTQMWHTHQFAIELVGPAVITAAKSAD